MTPLFFDIAYIHVFLQVPRGLLLKDSVCQQPGEMARGLGRGSGAPGMLLAPASAGQARLQLMCPASVRLHRPGVTVSDGASVTRIECHSEAAHRPGPGLLWLRSVQCAV